VAVFHNPNDTRHDDTNVRAAVRLAVVVAALSVGFLVTAALWVSTCNGATADTAACGVPQRTMLAIGAPVILLIGGLRAFVRTYQTWRDHEAWWAWQGAGWRELGFSIDGEHRFTYQYSPDPSGLGATLRAVGDVACDGTTTAVELQLTVTSGALTRQWSRKPAVR